MQKSYKANWLRPLSHWLSPIQADSLAQLWGMQTVFDLVHFFPIRYSFQEKIQSLNQIKAETQQIFFRAKLLKLSEMGLANKKRLLAVVELESSGEIIELLWFKNYKKIHFALQAQVGSLLFFEGKPQFFLGKCSLQHPLFFKERIFSPCKVAYPPLPAKYKKFFPASFFPSLFFKIMSQEKELFVEIFPQEVLEKLQLIDRYNAYCILHQPPSEKALAAAKKRMALEELFFLQWQMSLHKEKMQLKGFGFEQIGEFFHGFYEKLPFALTGAQKKVLKEIRQDLKTGAQMNRLIQGDVGSGKTMVAFLSLLMAVDNGFQGLLLAPTEVLAKQHFNAFSKQAAAVFGDRLQLGYLSGQVKGKARKSLLEGLEAGKVHLLIGTHAVLEEKVVFANLGMAIIDEQQRFGVAQRAALWKKNKLPPHVLVMTATPIPRTLAMSLYGDLSISIIDELPQGRKPINTLHVTEGQRLWVLGQIEKAIALGRQVYVVYPLIEQSEHFDYNNLLDGYNALLRRFPRPQYQIAMVHGQMSAEEKNAEMQRFVEGICQIMVATTVIEVGVNVPNASLMIIENAEKFGLSQLHQLRGRVGRGSEKSYCFLLTSKTLNPIAKQRIQTMLESQDGFLIAERDLLLRGSGDLQGTQQSGHMQLQFGNSSDPILLKITQNLLEYLLQNPQDSTLEQLRADFLSLLEGNRKNWGLIS